MISRGAPWGEPVEAGERRIVAGLDRDLARALAASRSGELVVFEPTQATDFSRALGVAPGPSGEPSLALGVDLMSVDEREPAVNAVVVGTPPGRLGAMHRSFRVDVECDGRPAESGRAQCVIVANGQFVDGVDAVPRGHPGDGWLEVQLYDVPRGQRQELRRRVATGSHLPHPGIVQRRARRVVVRTDRRVPVTVDGERWSDLTRIVVELTRPAGRVGR